MAHTAPARAEIPTESPQLRLVPPQGTPAVRRKRAAITSVLAGTARAAAGGDGRLVLEVGYGITVYPPAVEGERWRAVWYEDGQRCQAESVREDKLAAKLERVKVRLASGAEHLQRPGADLIAWYLNPDRRHPRGRPWSRRHADTQRRLCQRFAAPVIAAVTCQDITTAHMQKIVNSAPTQGEGERLHRCLSALVNAGLAAGYLVSPRLRDVWWQAGGRPVPEPGATVAGEASQWVDPAGIPAGADVDRLGKALAQGRRGDLDELMAQAVAYTGLRQGEEFALTIGQVDTGSRVIDVDRKVVEVSGKQYIETPKGRKRRKTIYPARTPSGYPLAARIEARIEAVKDEMDRGLNPLGLMFPSPRFKIWRSSNFDRRVLAPAYALARWRDEHGNGDWTWHSLRHVFCTTALFTWKLDANDVAPMAGHANTRVTLEMYVGTTAGVLDRARTATQ